MGKASPITTSFNGGELSPSIAGRVDVAKWANGCERMQGFLPTVQGPAITRPGFRFVSEVKDSADRSWLVRFEFSVEQSYILEFGDLYIRFYTNRAQLLSGGSAYEIASPYAAADLTNSDGTFALRYVQTGDVIYIVHPDYAPRKLVRTAATSWAISELDLVPPPFKERNDTATTIYASAATGSVTLEASGAVFTSDMVGQYIWLGEKSARSVKMWEPAKSINAGDRRRSDGHNYLAANTATTGAIKPTHREGSVYDGDTGVQWTYEDPGFGFAKITAVTDSNTATATVISAIPNDAVGVGNPTTRWALQAWNDTDGWPTCVTFFRERLVFARNSSVWFSVAGDFENFSTTVDGEETADAGFDRTLASDRVNNIRWLSPGNVLLIGTSGDEWALVEQTTTEPFGPTNCQSKRQSTYGSSYVQPVRVGDVTLFMQKSGRKMRAMAFRFEEDGFKSDDTTVFSKHVTRPAIVDMAFQQEPLSIVWCVRSDGVLVAQTFNREQDVVAWHRQPLADAFVECVEEIPSPDGTCNDVWIIARYTIDGSTKRYIAYLSDIDEEGDTIDQEDWAESDMHLKYDGAPATTISGLDHLEGKEVWVLADGAYHPNRTVSSGAITLQAAASKVTVGLPNPAYLQPMQINAGANDGTSQGRTKRVHKVVVRVLASCAGRAGPSEATLQDMQFRSPGTPMGTASPPFTGDIEIDWPGDYGLNASTLVVRSKPMPMRVVAIMPQVVTS